MNSELEDLLNIPIDLNNMNSLPEYIQIQVLIANRQLFCKDDLLEQKLLDKVNNIKDFKNSLKITDMF